LEPGDAALGPRFAVATGKDSTQFGSLDAFQFAAVLPVHFSSAFWLYLGYRVGMDELEEERLRDATMSHHEIMVRFKKLFAREMTPKERQAFFLGPDSTEQKQK